MHMGFIRAGLSDLRQCPKAYKRGKSIVTLANPITAKQLFRLNRRAVYNFLIFEDYGKFYFAVFLSSLEVGTNNLLTFGV